MTTSFLSVQDLLVFSPDLREDLAQAYIEDATVIATLVAPCLGVEPSTLTDNQVLAVRAILRGAILRWNEAGTGALSAQAAGPFSQTLDTRQTRKAMFWPSEIQQLQDICGGIRQGNAFSIDTVPDYLAISHLDTCSVYFGGDCSCGAILLGGTV